MEIPYRTVEGYNLGTATVGGTAGTISGGSLREILETAATMSGDFFVESSTGPFHFKNGKIWHGGWKNFKDALAAYGFAERLT